MKNTLQKINSQTSPCVNTFISSVPVVHYLKLIDSIDLRPTQFHRLNDDTHLDVYVLKNDDKSPVFIETV